MGDYIWTAEPISHTVQRPASDDSHQAALVSCDSDGGGTGSFVEKNAEDEDEEEDVEEEVEVDGPFDKVLPKRFSRRSKKLPWTVGMLMITTVSTIGCTPMRIAPK